MIDFRGWFRLSKQISAEYTVFSFFFTTFFLGGRSSGEERAITEGKVIYPHVFRTRSRALRRRVRWHKPNIKYTGVWCSCMLMHACTHAHTHARSRVWRCMHGMEVVTLCGGCALSSLRRRLSGNFVLWIRLRWYRSARSYRGNLTNMWLILSCRSGMTLAGRKSPRKKEQDRKRRERKGKRKKRNFASSIRILSWMIRSNKRITAYRI